MRITIIICTITCLKIGLLFSSCGNTSIDSSKEPRIKISSFPDSIIQLSIIPILISLEDGDGKFEWTEEYYYNDCYDLCVPINSDTSCINISNYPVIVTDQRTNCQMLSSVRSANFFSNDKKTNAIKGKLLLDIGPICCLPPDSSAGCIPNFNYPKDTINGTIQVRDRSGNYSNTISFGPVIIDCTK